MGMGVESSLSELCIVRRPTSHWAICLACLALINTTTTAAASDYDDNDADDNHHVIRLALVTFTQLQLAVITLCRSFQPIFIFKNPEYSCERRCSSFTS